MLTRLALTLMPFLCSSAVLPWPVNFAVVAPEGTPSAGHVAVVGDAPEVHPSLRFKPFKSLFRHNEPLREPDRRQSLSWLRAVVVTRRSPEGEAT